jgi:hypothetical protein
MADDLYFIRAGDFVKIGRARDVRQRASAIRCACPLEIEEIIIHQGRGDEERLLHRSFRGDHVRGEWFKWSDRIERRARHPVLSLPPDEVQRRYEELLGGRNKQRFAVAQGAAHSVHGRFYGG